MCFIPCSISTVGEGSGSYDLSISQGFERVWWEDPKSGLREGEGPVLSVVQKSRRQGFGLAAPPPAGLPDRPRPRARAGGPLQVRGAGGARGGRNRAWFRTRGGFPERQWNSEVAPDLGPDSRSFQRDPAVLPLSSLCPPSSAALRPPLPALRSQSSVGMTGSLFKGNFWVSQHGAGRPGEHAGASPGAAPLTRESAPGTAVGRERALPGTPGP